jgi:hypothetical protein
VWPRVWHKLVRTATALDTDFFLCKTSFVVIRNPKIIQNRGELPFMATPQYHGSDLTPIEFENHLFGAH